MESLDLLSQCEGTLPCQHRSYDTGDERGFELLMHVRQTKK